MSRPNFNELISETICLILAKREMNFGGICAEIAKIQKTFGEQDTSLVSDVLKGAIKLKLIKKNDQNIFSLRTDMFTDGSSFNSSSDESISLPFYGGSSKRLHLDNSSNKGPVTPTKILKREKFCPDNSKLKLLPTREIKRQMNKSISDEEAGFVSQEHSSDCRKYRRDLTFAAVSKIFEEMFQCSTEEMMNMAKLFYQDKPEIFYNDVIPAESIKDFFEFYYSKYVTAKKSLMDINKSSCSNLCQIMEEANVVAPIRNDLNESTDDNSSLDVLTFGNPSQLGNPLDSPELILRKRVNRNKCEEVDTILAPRSIADSSPESETVSIEKPSISSNLLKRKAIDSPWFQSKRRRYTISLPVLHDSPPLKKLSNLPEEKLKAAYRNIFCVGNLK